LVGITLIVDNWQLMIYEKILPKNPETNANRKQIKLILALCSWSFLSQPFDLHHKIK